MDASGEGEDDTDIMNHLNYQKLERIYNDYDLLGG
jgi:hypothetical protein